MGAALGAAAPGLVLIGASAALMALRSWRPGPAWSLLGGGLIVFAVVDPVAGAALVALAAWRPITKEQTARPDGVLGPIVTGIMAAAAIAVLVADAAWSMPAAAIALAAATVIVAMARSVVAVRDVRSLADSRRQARTDELTNLGNRRMFYERLEKALANRAEQEGLALLLVDLDRFKEINDSLGHRVGDELLRQIGPRLDSAMRPGDVLARLGGDEFALLVPASGPDFAREIAARIRAAIAQP